MTVKRIALTATLALFFALFTLLALAPTPPVSARDVCGAELTDNCPSPGGSNLPSDQPAGPQGTLASAMQPSGAQLCAERQKAGPAGLYVLSATPYPDLVWDIQPRVFRVEVCNSLKVATMPHGRLVVMVRVPDSKAGGGQTSPIMTQIEPGYHEYLFESWKPGLENHVTVCVQRQVVEIEVRYSDDEATAFWALEWFDGSRKTLSPIKCGGTFA